MNQQDIILRQNFHEEMIALYKRIVKELKYKSPRLIEMINKYGGYEAAIKMLPTDAHTFDFTLMWEHQRLDLSIEALVTKEKYKGIFPEDIVSFCQRRLDEYNYAPNKIVPEEEEVIEPFTEEVVEQLFPQLEEEVVQSFQMEDYIETPISVVQWTELFMKTSIFTAKNQDLILKMYSTGSLNISPEILAGLEGYSSKYPFYEVILSLCKRIKAALKIEVPKNNEGKLLWWQFLFTGYYESNQNFLFNLRPELDEALTKLMLDGKIEKVERDVQPEYETLEVIQITPPEPEIEEQVEEVTEAKLPPIKKSIVSPTGEIPSLDDFIDFLIDEPIKPKQEPIATSPSIDLEPSAIPQLQPMMAFHSESLEEKEEEHMDSKIDVQTESDLQSIDNEDTTLSLWESKKQECLDYYGAVCELCGFDFGYTYGIDFEKLIKVYNLKPEKPLENINPHEDLMPICHNCEAVIHARTPNFTIEDVRGFIAQAKDAD